MKLKDFISQLKKYPAHDLARVLDKRSKKYYYFGFKYTNDNIIIFRIANEGYWASPLTYGQILISANSDNLELEVKFSDNQCQLYEVA